MLLYFNELKRELSHLTGKRTLTRRSFPLLAIEVRVSKSAGLALDEFKGILNIVSARQSLMTAGDHQRSAQLSEGLEKWLMSYGNGLEDSSETINSYELHTYINQRNWIYWQSKITSNDSFVIYLNILRGSEAKLELIGHILRLMCARIQSQYRINSTQLLSVSDKLYMAFNKKRNRSSSKFLYEADNA